MKTLEQMRLDPAIQAEANRIYEAALKMPRPSCYSKWSDAEWQGGCFQMVEDLMVLSHKDGCVAGAWATMVIEGLVKHCDGGAT